jgi:acyl-CoA thioesterase-1
VRRLSAGALALWCIVWLGLWPGEARSEGVVVALGDSLTAGLGVGGRRGISRATRGASRAEGYAYRVVNAGVSGDTTAGGLRRVDWVLRSSPEVVIVALGANDGLRGQSPPAMRANLDEIVARLQAAGARVLLAGCACLRTTEASTRRSSRRYSRPSLEARRSP